jgi:hypothetical protein
MKLRSLALATAAASLAASPVVAQAAFERAGAPLDGDESEVFGLSLLPLQIGAAAVTAVAVAAADDDNEPVSP